MSRGSDFWALVGEAEFLPGMRRGLAGARIGVEMHDMPAFIYGPLREGLPRADFVAGDVVVTAGAYQMHLAMKNKANGGADSHAGHHH